MRRVFYLVIAVAFFWGMTGTFFGCGDTTGSTKHCTDPDYPLWCPDHGYCCPGGYPVSCAAKCYKTTSDARAQCGGSIDTCEPEK